MPRLTGLDAAWSDCEGVFECRCDSHTQPILWYRSNALELLPREDTQEELRILDCIQRSPESIQVPTHAQAEECVPVKRNVPLQPLQQPSSLFCILFLVPQHRRQSRHIDVESPFDRDLC